MVIGRCQMLCIKFMKDCIDTVSIDRLDKAHPSQSMKMMHKQFTQVMKTLHNFVRLSSLCHISVLHQIGVDSHSTDTFAKQSFTH